MEHEDLMEKGEKWMRDTADSGMFVATLIATVLFAVAFTIPGGKNQAGNPMLLHEAQFQVFAVGDAISLIFSVSAVLNFLSTLTSCYALKDLLQNLPKKLVQGLGILLFISVVAVMVAYIAVILVIFKNGLLQIAIRIAVIAIFPGVLLIRQQSGLLCDVRSTYTSKSLFQPNKPTFLYAGAS